MGSVLLVAVPHESANLIRERLTDHHIESVAGEAGIAAALARPANDLDALVIGPQVESRVRVVQQASAADRDLAVLIVCRDTDHTNVAQSLRFAPSVGRDVRPVVPSFEGPLADLVADAVIRTRQRRQHRSLMAAVRSATDENQVLPLNLEGEIRESEERFRLVVEAVTDPIVTIEADGRIHSANAAVETVFGYPASELVGQPLTVLMPESLRAAHEAAFREYLQTGKPSIPWTELRFPGRHKSGREISLDLSFGEFASGERHVFTGIFHDVSERLRKEEELRRDAAHLKESNVSFKRVLQEEFAEIEVREKLAKITLSVDSALTLTEALDKVFENFAAIIPYERMACALLEENGETANYVWMHSLIPATHIIAGLSANLERTGLGGLLEAGQPRVTNDLEDYLRTHPDSESTQRLIEDGMRSSLACPLISMGKPLGFMFFSSIRPCAYSDSHVEIFGHIAEQLSVIVERGRLWQQLLETQRELEVRNKFIAEVFGRYTSESIASQVLSSPEGLNMGGETRTVTVLFADLRGFTPLCSVLDPQRVVRLLNIHLSEMTEVILSHGGTIDEFIGDAILVIFGAPVFAVEDASRAVACAIAMQRAMDIVKEKLSAEGLPSLEMGIALHTGTVVAGNLGSQRRAKYGVVGSVVNLVTRIESFTAGGQILCTEDTMREAGDDMGFEKGPVINVKGSDEPVRTFSVHELPVQSTISPPSSSRVITVEHTRKAEQEAEAARISQQSRRHGRRRS